MASVNIPATDSCNPARLLSPSVLDEFETKADGIRYSAEPILSPCVKHEIEGRDSHYA